MNYTSEFVPRCPIGRDHRAPCMEVRSVIQECTEARSRVALTANIRSAMCDKLKTRALEIIF
jgi:hypothetical protein